MTINTKREGSQVTLSIEGRVDTNTSPQLQSKILEAFRSAKDVVLDFQKVPYISSAGLRALLIGQKTAASKRASMVLINVSPGVMQVLETVGFADILTIR
ncbi:STAS domain-containing protein [Pseudoflavonifractor phocaeensis]|uniref:STAS domain-containing protein n=1 Tax=Pseudoflavonifractor phocaeensis TaxID=1870988 RepID=UPI00195BA4FE|nr:STAS domain-containing protein [Pseudoflavonifractor phocaeensis]MBM6924816.1 STAS domain-containing protein [Pseudoflavonifractor phocaeensis]